MIVHEYMSVYYTYYTGNCIKMMPMAAEAYPHNMNNAMTLTLDNRFTCKTRIIGWSFYAHTLDDFHVNVFRNTSDGQYQLLYIGT